jgi:hypothetical protein
MFREAFNRLTRRSTPGTATTHATVRVPAKGFQVLYAPDLDGDPDPGEVCWAWIPYEDDPKQGKDRPVIVIGRDGDGLVVVPLTTKPHPERDDEVEVGSGGWDRGLRASYAKVDDVLVVTVHDVRREGAVLDRKRFDQVLAGIDAYRGRHPGH